MNVNFIIQIYFLSVFVFICYLLYHLFAPFLHAIIIAGILASLFYPANQFFIHRGYSKNLASILSCLAVILIIVLPILFIVTRLSVEIINLYDSQKQFLNIAFLKEVISKNNILPWLNSYLIYVDIQINSQEISDLAISAINNAGSFIINTAKSWITATFSFTFTLLFQFVVMLIFLFSFLTDGDKLILYIKRMAPLTEEQSDEVFNQFFQMNYVSFVSNGMGSLLQASLAGLALWFAGIETIFFWSTVMFIFAFIPLVGISFVTVPFAIYLFVIEEYFFAFFILIFCTIVALVVENYYKPRVIGKRTQVNSVFLLMGIIGGLSYFGMLGIFYGPLVITGFLIFVSYFNDMIGKKSSSENLK